MQRVIENLLENAFEATLDEDPVEVVLTAGDGCVELRVRDSGCGMTREELAHAFEPFVSGKGGLGLGLTACRDIVEALGGEISVESTPGGPTEVTCRFPAAGEVR